MSHPGYEDPSSNQPEQPPAPTDPVSPPTIHTQAVPLAESPAPAQYTPTSPAAPSPSAPSPSALSPFAPSEPLTPAYSAGNVAVPTGPVAGPVAGPPGYGQTPPYPPVPAAPTYDPAAVGQTYSAQPYPTQPYSTQPYSTQPYSAPPISGPYGYGMPMASAIPAPPEKRGRAGTVILSILTTLFLVAAGVLGTLFILKNQEADKLSSQVTQLTGETTTQRGRIDTLLKDLDNTKRDLTDARADTDEVTEHKKVISDCLNAIYEYFDALNTAGGANTAAVRTADAAAEKKCNEADKYLAPAR